MRKFKIVAWLSAALLAACGGGNTITGTKGPTGGPSTVSSLTVSSSAASIAADGSDSATITAVAKDANNNLVKDATVSFNASAGGLAVTQATTDANGRATATLNAGGASAGTSITVTASTGGVSGTTTVNVVNTQQTLSLTTSAPQIPSDSSKKATIKALMRDASNNALAGVTVSFAATSGNLIITNATTDATGVASATLDAGGSPINRTITVTANSGSATAKVTVDVTGTALSITGPVSLVQGAQGVFNITLIDSGTNGISGSTVTLTSTNGNTLSAQSVTTDSLGHASVTLTGSKGGNDSVVASALGLTAQQSLVVSTNSFAITAPVAAAKVNLGAVQPVTVHWTSGGANIADGTVVQFSTTRGTLSAPSATTSGGNAQVTITSAVAGPAVISASGTGVSTQVTIDFISVTPASIAVQASPSTIPTAGQSTISAIVRDAQNNLVEGQTIDFSTINDVTGGSLSPAVALTDSQGRAQTVYTASPTASASSGVTVQAVVRGTSPVISGTADLTVGGKTVKLALGTGNVIGANAADTAFIVPYFVQAIDSGGNAVPNIQITLTIHSLNYGKGTYYWDGVLWTQTRDATVANPVPGVTVCPNEDANFNGVLDPGEDGLPGDAGLPTFNAFGNKNGLIESGDVATVSPGVVTTDASGFADLNVTYPQDHAQWIQAQLTATATVTGTQASDTTIFWLPMSADKVNKQTVRPPGMPSPYGIAQVCTNPN
ncbi:MAG: Ig-like domain-containing protein [Steroidobacteraceae bacterium]